MKVWGIYKNDRYGGFEAGTKLGLFILKGFIVF